MRSPIRDCPNLTFGTSGHSRPREYRSGNPWWLELPRLVPRRGSVWLQRVELGNPVTEVSRREWSL